MHLFYIDATYVKKIVAINKSCAGETLSGVLCPDVESSVQEIHGPVGVPPEECHHDSLRDGTASLQGQAESWGCAAWRREGSREG